MTFLASCELQSLQVALKDLASAVQTAHTAHTAVGVGHKDEAKHIAVAADHSNVKAAMASPQNCDPAVSLWLAMPFLAPAKLESHVPTSPNPHHFTFRSKPPNACLRRSSPLKRPWSDPVRPQRWILLRLLCARYDVNRSLSPGGFFFPQILELVSFPSLFATLALPLTLLFYSPSSPPLLIKSLDDFKKKANEVMSKLDGIRSNLPGIKQECVDKINSSVSHIGANPSAYWGLTSDAGKTQFLSSGQSFSPFFSGCFYFILS